MPELPEVETVCRGLAPILEGQKLVRVVQRRADLRFPLPERFAERLEGRRVLSVSRRAKYILTELDDAEVLITHLGMSGRMFIGEAARPPDAHDHVILETEAGRAVVFNDARRFGMMDLVPRAGLASHKLLRDLGPEPLGNAFDGALLSARLEGRRTPIKSALLDQRVVAGLGNIYVSEALHRAGISPRRSAATVAGRRAELLAPAIRAVLEEAIAAGGSTLRDYVQASGELGYFQHAFRVYDREGQPCPGCSGACRIRRIVQSGRSTYYCPTRQR
ncbi:MAG: bifunctional DNA-formamidopyrimidine glycosylase/DNA-(apurinic or apyrimidinic site) lyase [Alphaproteobacteria bacterium]|nr:bifunctional DNA-formamidopyrimidine glycosylase/DNA-(apurinic or apyrimidinic site) lyase [Alphaproteobacteria bacterium]